MIAHRHECYPAAERERRLDRDAVERNLQVGTWKPVAMNFTGYSRVSAHRRVNLRPVDLLGLRSGGKRQRTPQRNSL